MLRNDWPDGSYEEDRVLRNDGQLGPEVLQTQCGDVNPIQLDGSRLQLHQSKQGYAKWWLSWKETVNIHVISFTKFQFMQNMHVH